MDREVEGTIARKCTTPDSKSQSRLEAARSMTITSLYVNHYNWNIERSY